MKKRTNKTTHIVGLTVCLGISAFMFIFYFYEKQHFDACLKHEPTILQLDLSKPNVYEAEFIQKSHRNVHYIAILYIKSEITVSDNSSIGATFEGLKGTVEILNHKGELVQEFLLEDPIYFSSTWTEKYPGWRCKSLESGHYKLRFTVVEPAKAFNSQKQLLMKRNRLKCGCSYRMEQEMNIFGGSLFLLLSVISLISIIRKSRKRKTLPCSD